MLMHTRPPCCKDPTHHTVLPEAKLPRILLKPELATQLLKVPPVRLQTRSRSLPSGNRPVSEMRAVAPAERCNTNSSSSKRSSRWAQVVIRHQSCKRRDSLKLNKWVNSTWCAALCTMPQLCRCCTSLACGKGARNLELEQRLSMCCLYYLNNLPRPRCLAVKCCR